MSHPRRLRIATRTATLLGALAAMCAFGVDNAQAIPYFNGPDGFGLDNSTLGLSPKFTIESAADFHPAGSKKLDDGSFDIILVATQKITEMDGSFRVDVTWKIESKLSTPIDRVLILFTSLGGPPDFPDYSDQTPFEITNMKRDGFATAEYTSSAGVSYTLAGFSIKNLLPGEENARERRFSYVVDGDIAGDFAPALGVTAVFNVIPVPEPSTTVLMGVALLGLVAVRGRRCDS